MYKARQETKIVAIKKAERKGHSFVSEFAGIFSVLDPVFEKIRSVYC